MLLFFSNLEKTADVDYREISFITNAYQKYDTEIIKIKLYHRYMKNAINRNKIQRYWYTNYFYAGYLFIMLIIVLVCH